MNKYTLLVLITAIIAPITFISCSESSDEDNEFEDWKNRNEQYFSDVYLKAKDCQDGSWKIIRNYSLEDTINIDYDQNIVVEVINEGNGSGCPLFSDSVLVDYRGSLIPTIYHTSGYVFDQSYTDDYNPLTANPAKLYVGNTVDGFATALQHMHIGDQWRVYIPYRMGYGSTDNSDIPAFSTLIFDIALRAYSRPGTPLPQY